MTVEAAVEEVEVGGVRIAYQRRGHGPPLLLLHGLVCDGRVWREQLDALADDFTVVAWDAPGCGGSSDPPGPFRMPEFAACLTGFIDQLGLDRPHVLGHSWGSSLALEIYRTHASSVRSLVLVGAYAGWAGSLPPDEIERRLAFALHAADPASPAFDPISMPGIFSAAMPAERAEELVAIMSEIRPAGTREMAVALAAADQRDLLPQVTVPVLLLHGEADERSPIELAEDIHRSMPTSTLVILPGLGHECFMESGGTFNAAVRAFLKNIAV